MLKKEFPILEFDPNREAKIMPKRAVDKLLASYHGHYQKLVICYFREVIEQLLNSSKIEPLLTLKSECQDITVYKFCDNDCCLVQGVLGSPAAVGYLEEYIALGFKYIVCCGGAGVLERNTQVGDLFLIGSALRDEGTSYHYQEPTRIVEANPQMVELLSKTLDSNKLPYKVARTWTTDAFYRETRDKIQTRIEEGCSIVEMEQSAMITVAKYRDILYGAVIYGGDDLSNDEWDSRKWRSRDSIRYNLCILMKETLSKLA